MIDTRGFNRSYVKYMYNEYIFILFLLIVLREEDHQFSIADLSYDVGVSLLNVTRHFNHTLNKVRIDNISII